LSQLIDEGDSIQDARRAIGDIVNIQTRRTISEAFEQRIATGKSAWLVLQDPISHKAHTGRDGTGSIIRRVIAYQRDGRGLANGSEATSIVHKARAGQDLKKSYMPPKSNKYAFVAVMIEGDPPREYAVSVTRTAARQLDKRLVVRRIFKMDTVIDRFGTRYLVHQIHANGKIAVAPLTEARNWGEIQSAGGAKTFGARDVVGLMLES
jgi:hypothetical protein